jgi:DNA repair protein RadC
MLGGPDVILTEPARVLALSVPVRRMTRPNPLAKAPSRFEIDADALTLYDGHESLLVRTALIRATDWKNGVKHAPIIQSSQDVQRLCKHLAWSARELVVVLVCDTKQRVVAIHEHSGGGVASSNVDVPSILQVVMLANGLSMILVHNHPSGVARPSDDDIQLTRELAKAAKCSGYTLSDSVIIGESETYFSMLDAGMMPRSF